MFKDMFNQFERIPASERQTDRQTDRYPAMAYSALCIASRSRNGRFRPIYRCISQTVRNMAIFLPRDAYAYPGLWRCKMSVCPSHDGIVCKQLHILKGFSPSCSPTILVFPHQTGWQYSDGDAITGASNARGFKQKLSSYSKQIARKLRTQYVESIYRPKYYTMTCEI